jgi:hypothetical protein
MIGMQGIVGMAFIKNPFILIVYYIIKVLYWFGMKTCLPFGRLLRRHLRAVVPRRLAMTGMRACLLLITGKNGKSNTGRFFKLHAVQFIIKPFQLQQLLVRTHFTDLALV